VRPGIFILFVAAALVLAAGPALASGGTDTLEVDTPGTLEFAPAPPESLPAAETRWGHPSLDAPECLGLPFGERLLTEPEVWGSRHRRGGFRLEPVGDYNRVDGVRLGIAAETQDPGSMLPRVGGRIEYALGRKRTTYGAQLEQPLLARARLGVGVSVSRRTDHSDLQQVDDVENSLALLFARQDYRDYFEREGCGAYVALRVPDVSIVSVHVRNDTYRSLALRPDTRSWFARDRELRDNPAVTEGEAHAVLLRLERQPRRAWRAHAGLYHWIEVERAGAGLGGDFAYTRGLADLRSVLRLTPGTTLVLRAAGGTTTAGTLPPQKQFTLGGVDGLRAHAFGRFRGDQLLLGQAECTVALPRPDRSAARAARGSSRSVAHAIVFVDAGDAWLGHEHAWDPAEQHIKVDGGVGLTTAEDNMRIYVARNLQRARASAMVSLRLQRPF
jgi:hypothetical protein